MFAGAIVSVFVMMLSLLCAEHMLNHLATTALEELTLSKSVWGSVSKLRHVGQRFFCTHTRPVAEDNSNNNDLCSLSANNR